jgi:5-methylcytosine-specific restriction endonuclease McrA
MDLEWEYAAGAAVIAVALLVGLWAWSRFGPGGLRARIERKTDELRTAVELWFMVEPCFKCHEYAMRLLEISPNARSVHYQCVHCKKKTRSPAGTPDAPRVTEMWNELVALVEQYNARVGPSEQVTVNVEFVAPASPLPYEQTTRTSIPEAVRSEVWRRDGGRCVTCGSKQNLQFDHIIPVSEGGATSTANLQLMCQPCNAAKGKKI